VFTVEVVS